MPVQQIIAVLEHMEEIHRKLLDLADRKRGALVRNEVDEVSSIVNKETKAIRAIDECLRKQSTATAEFFQARGFQPTRAITVTELSRLLTDPAQKEALLSARDRLAETVAALKAKNELNQQLIEQSLAYINYSIDLVLGPEEEPMYRNPNTRQPYGGNRSGYFDSKA